MIPVLFLWNRIDAYGAKYQSGTDVVAYFNSALAEVQSEVFNDFAPLYQENEKVKTLMDIFVREQTGSSNSSGVVTVGTNPEVVCRPLSVGYTDGSGNLLFSIPQTDETELIAITRIPQRVPNVATKNVYYRFNAPATMLLYPKTTIPYDMFYLVYPPVANIVFTFSETDDEDIMTYSNSSVDLIWPEAATNLILYKLLEKYSINVREQLLEEYSKFGFTQTATAGEDSRQ